MKKPNSLQFVLSAKKIISVNALYGAKLTYTGSKPIATLYKKSEAKMMENYIKSQVKALDIPVNHPWVTKDTKFKFTFTVIFKSGYFMRDLDNCCKNLIDGIFRALGYNDSHICEIHCFKTLCPDIPEEKICIEMSEYTGEYRFDKVSENIPAPPKIYLNTPEDIALVPPKEHEVVANKEDADCEIYILSPSYHPMSVISEIISSSYESALGGYGSVFLGVLGSMDEWGDDSKEIARVMHQVNEISGGSPRIMAKTLSSPDEILTCIKKPKKSRK